MYYGEFVLCHFDLSRPFCSALCLCMYFLSSYFFLVVCMYLILFVCLKIQ